MLPAAVVVEASVVAVEAVAEALEVTAVAGAALVEVVVEALEVTAVAEAALAVGHSWDSFVPIDF